MRRAAGAAARGTSPRTWRLAALGTTHALLRGVFGWGNMPPHTVAEDIAARRLVRLSLEGWESDEGPLFSIHRRDCPPGPATRWLVARLRATF